jgi:DNA topoisomerase 2-associated protein PAT1
MSFFGFDATLPERRGGLPNPASGGGGLGGYDDDQAGAEDVAVYTWGNEDYDGLGDQLQEQGDDANDDTFGGGDIGQSITCFDLTSSAI